MTQVITFSLGANSNSPAPTLPAPLDRSQYITRQELQTYNDACEAFYQYERDLAKQARIDADNKRSAELAEANRPQTDKEYDDMKREQWQAARDKEALRLAAEKQVELDKIAYRLSSPPVVELSHRGEFSFLKDIEFWVSRGYSLGDDSIKYFQPGFYCVSLTAPAKKAGK